MRRCWVRGTNRGAVDRGIDRSEGVGIDVEADVRCGCRSRKARRCMVGGFRAVLLPRDHREPIDAMNWLEGRRKMVRIRPGLMDSMGIVR